MSHNTSRPRAALAYAAKRAARPAAGRAMTEKCRVWASTSAGGAAGGEAVQQVQRAVFQLAGAMSSVEEWFARRGVEGAIHGSLR